MSIGEIAKEALAATQTSAVRVRGLSRSFDTGQVLYELDLDIAPGEFVALLGRNGSGKTTLLRTLARLDPAPEGVVQAPFKRAVIFQDPRSMPRMRVWKNIVLGLPRSVARTRAVAALSAVGPEQRLDARPATWSVADARRASLTRAFARQPELLLLDEPFAALDPLTRLKMHQLITDLWRRHSPAVLLVTNDVDEAVLLADRVMVLSDGRIAHEETIRQQRPRRTGDPTCREIRRRLLGALGVEDGAVSAEGADQIARMAGP